MDLERCPKCGSDWTGGDKCRKCGFVPVGAGLDKLPKKRKKKAKRYVEPGSWRPFLLTTLVVASGYGCFAYQPWKDDWELVRVLMGQGRRHSIVGEWEVVKSVTVKKGEDQLISGKVNKGTLVFSKAGTIKVNLVRGNAKSVGSGKYEVSGQMVALTNIAPSSTSAGRLPKTMTLKLAWTGEDSVVATTKSEALYLRKRKGETTIASLVQLGLKPGKGEAPSAMRGVIATMKDNIAEEIE